MPLRINRQAVSRVAPSLDGDPGCRATKAAPKGHAPWGLGGRGLWRVGFLVVQAGGPGSRRPGSEGVNSP